MELLKRVGWEVVGGGMVGEAVYKQQRAFFGLATSSFALKKSTRWTGFWTEVSSAEPDFPDS